MHTRPVPHYRSPTFIVAIGIGLLGLGVGSWLLAANNLFGWLCLLIATAVLTEAYYWRRAARIAAIYYDRTPDHIERQAYSLKGALLRSAVVFAFALLVFVMGRGGLDALPTGGWLVLLILAPVSLQVLWAALAYRRDVLHAAKRGKWRRRVPLQR